ncbi:MAG: agmatine deiminase family protein [Inquilinaceae bacterium]
MPSTPAAEGYRMPAEWRRHDRCWMAWPTRAEIWERVDRQGRAKSGLDAAGTAYAAVARAIAEFEPVTMVCNPSDVAEASLACGTGVDVLSMPIDDSWMRDVGPTFLIPHGTGAAGGLAAVDWRFNGWGGRYPDFDDDQEVAALVASRAGARWFEAPLVLEGGAVHTDGEGTLLTTEQCLLNPNRNPDMDRGRVETLLRDYLGVSTIVWLPRGLEDDETDGHIDEIACFARPGLVLAVSTDDRSDGNYEILQDNLERLRGATDAAGRSLEVVTLPQPPRREYEDGTRIALSYVNLYVANGAVIAPAFEVAEDERAHRILREAFPGRKVIPVPAGDIAIGGGGIHCITQQQPALTDEPPEG